MSEEKDPVENPENKDQETKLDESKLRYEDGKCFYADPKTGSELEWSDDKQAWIPTQDKQKDYIYEDGTYSYIDKTTGVKYKWNTVNNKWDVCSVKIRIDEEEEEEEMEDGETKVVKKSIVRQDMSQGVYSYEGDTHIYTDPNDGTVYEWDKVKNAWFPRINDDFLAQYQMSYGVSDSDKTEEKEEIKEAEEVKIKEDPTLKRKAPEPPTWFEVDDTTNTKVYVSNLPLNITEQEFVDLMQKCGLVMKDVDSGKMKVKLYTEHGSDMLKGDALCSYIKVESVELALNLLDGYDFKGKKIKVERAKFTMKGGSYDPTLKPKKKRRKDKDKIKKMQEKLFDWRPEKMRGERAKHERIVIIKNLFDPSDFDRDVGLILEYQQDLREECLKCGAVRKIVLFDRHPEGVAQINFKEAEAADACIQLLNGRWFCKRKITAETWDGKTKYKIAETEAEIDNRLKKWENFIQSEEDKKEKNAKNEDKKEENTENADKKDENLDKNTDKKDEDPSKGLDKKDENTEKEKNSNMDVEDDKNNDSDGTRSSAGSGDETD